MNVTSVSRPLDQVEAEWLALGVYEGQTEPPEVLQGTPLGEALTRLLSSQEVDRGVGDLTPVLRAAGLASGSLLLFGLGSRDAAGTGPAFSAGVAVAKWVSAKKRSSLAVALPEGGSTAGASDPEDLRSALASALTEGLIVGSRGPGLCKSDPSSGRTPPDRVEVVPHPDGPRLADAVRRGVVVGEAINLARDLANTPPRDKPPTLLAARAREEAVKAGLGVEVWDAERIRRERFGGLLGVSAGSDEPPAFVVLDYAHGGDAPTLALVGKGITFDSGGLSLKPSASMEDMKADMTGAAVVLATLCAAARLKLPVNVRGYLALAENMTGGRAMKLGDVLTMRDGTTVEVLNTDAEGRLILADALSYAVEAKPARVLDLATLTGACMVALGTRMAGFFSNDDGFAEEIHAASRATGERAWRLPLDDDFKEGLKSKVADLKNVAGKWGGAVTAAKFLQHFVQGTPWVHLDIAGPSWSDADGPTRDVGGTGCFVRTLVQHLESQAENPE